MLKKRIYIIDDQPVARESLRHLIQHRGRFAVCGESDGAAEAWPKIAAAKPDAVIMEISLPGVDGLQCLRWAYAAVPSLRVLVLSKEDENIYGERALYAGATGFISKQASTEAILEALRQVLAGEVYLSPHLATRLVNRMCRGDAARKSPMELLTNRELEVFRRIGRAQKLVNIARELKLSVKTIETYRERIKRKLQIDDRLELAQKAIEWVNHIWEA